MNDSIDAQNLYTHVHHMADTIGERHIFIPASLKQAANYIKDVWKDTGYEVTAYPYSVKGVQCSNYEITVPGLRKPNDIILIGAHYDSVPGSPAANDNASGVAALLELSRCLRNCRPAVTLRCVAFVNEEPPFFDWDQMGSMKYARMAKRRGDNIRFMVSLETIGFYTQRPGSQRYPPIIKHFYPPTGDFVAFVSNLRSRRVMKNAVRAFKAVSDFPLQHIATLAAVPGVSWSDHLSFWRQGYKAFMVTDTAFYRYPYYHGAGDTPEKLNYPAFAHMCEGLLQMFRRLASAQS
jgi:Zn-dependent M28 family amino/carboxypeptidase